MGRHLDLDTAGPADGRPAARPPITFTFRGREWELPGEMPAGMLLMVQTLGVDLETLMAPDAADRLDDLAGAVVAMARGVFGPMLDDLVAAGMTAEEMMRVMSWAAAEWKAPA